MKNLTLSLAFLCISNLTFTQSSQECEKFLEDGLYQLIKINTKSSFSSDIWTYFLSQQFRSDLKDGKWGGTLTLPINGVPISIGASSSNEQISTFQSTLQSATQSSIKIVDFVNVVRTLPNPELYAAYNDCIGIIHDNTRTGLILGKKVETEETVLFTFYYRPTGVNQPVPKVKSFTITPSSALVDGGGIKKGRKIPSFYVSVLAQRSEVNDVVLNLQTGNGFINDISSPTTSSKFETPVGTIIASYLSFDRFREITGTVGVWKRTDKWAPCDGRDVVGSKFSKFSSNNAPDLRGYFLRGLNTFDLTPPVGVNPVTRDILRVVGSPQDDQFAAHSHKIATMDGQIGIGPPNKPIKGNGASGTGWTTDSAGNGNETRPKNIAIYYYIKIN
ncbi:MAG TPA: hypothetical protein VFG10_09325 [Saprospiraceae bacterium]|nr:hypothetical protein [Saprospiraceae bacterium]